MLSQSLSKKEDGLKLGATHYYATKDPETFKALAGSFDLILCTVSAEIDWNAYLSLLKPDGAMVLLAFRRTLCRFTPSASSAAAAAWPAR